MLNQKMYFIGAGAWIKLVLTYLLINIKFTTKLAGSQPDNKAYC